MIEITEEYVYEREACDCCDGWYELQLHLSLDGKYIGEFTDALELMRYLKDNSKVFKYTEAEIPYDD